MPLVSVHAAAEILISGQQIGFPTETVYGLGANGLNPLAVAGIFALKGRPRGHPLILHATNPRPFARFDQRAELLAQFWPGPLTLVLARCPGVPDEVTGGRETVAVRNPAHPMAQQLLSMVDFPIAAPSANRFGEVSPTTAGHVLSSFPLLSVLDGGPCDVGVESTIVDLTKDEVVILRPGGIPAEAIAMALGLPLGTASDTAAPGTLASHYAPRARLELVADARKSAAAYGTNSRFIRARPAVDYAKVLYAELRAADQPGVEVIFAEMATPEGIGVAVNDRLMRAASR